MSIRQNGSIMAENKAFPTNEIFARNVRASLLKLTSCTKIKDMKLLFALSKFRQKYDQAAKIFEDAQNKLAGEFGERDKDGNLIHTKDGITIDNNRIKEFQERFKELLECEIEMGCSAIEIDLKKLPEDLLSADDIYNLEKLINFTV